jgi:hypothetical protein
MYAAAEVISRMCIATSAKSAGNEHDQTVMNSVCLFLDSSVLVSNVDLSPLPRA